MLSFVLFFDYVDFPYSPCQKKTTEHPTLVFQACTWPPSSERSRRQSPPRTPFSRPRLAFQTWPPSLLDSRFGPNLLDPAAAGCTPLPPGPPLHSSVPSTSCKLDGIFAAPSPGPRSWRETTRRPVAPDSLDLSWLNIPDFAGLNVHEPTPHLGQHVWTRGGTRCLTMTGLWTSVMPFDLPECSTRQHPLHRPKPPCMNGEAMIWSSAQPRVTPGHCDMPTATTPGLPNACGPPPHRPAPKDTAIPLRPHTGTSVPAPTFVGHATARSRCPRPTPTPRTQTTLPRTAHAPCATVGPKHAPRHVSDCRPKWKDGSRRQALSSLSALEGKDPEPLPSCCPHRGQPLSAGT